uniref:Uncharacterized protein LOC103320504 n=2 Tax=Rhizophora mucronata TaxID=61149 RepID=A0A2P2J597_RHIMU
MDFECSDLNIWKEALSSYAARIESVNKPSLVSLDQFYRIELPSLVHGRNPSPYITLPELSKLMQWKLSRGKWRPRLLDYVSSLDEALVKSASQKSFRSLPDLSKAVTELTVFKGIGPATASAVLATYAPDVAPFMSDEAMEAALGSSKDYSLKQYLIFADKLQNKAKELSLKGESFMASDVERALWSSAMSAKLPAAQAEPNLNTIVSRSGKRRKY